MPGHDLIVIGGSAGALTVLQQILGGLPADFPAAIFIVVHQAQSQPGRLPQVLARCGPLPAEHAADGQMIELGRVYVAPPDHHLLIERGRMRLSRGPKENRFRPAVDPLFRTAARAYGPQVIGVIVSGLLDDGTLGVIRINQFGGIVIAQDPLEAECPDMPASAVRNANVDHVLKAADIAGVLRRLVQEPGADDESEGVPRASAMSGASLPESATVPSEVGDSADRGDDALLSGHLKGSPSGFTCPQCGGALWERTEDRLLTYRCHVGHAYTADSMAAEHDSNLESTLWEALRMFQESAALHRRMERRAAENGQQGAAQRYAERAQEHEQRTETIRVMLAGDRTVAMH